RARIPGGVAWVQGWIKQRQHPMDRRGGIEASDGVLKKHAVDYLDGCREELADLQDRLFADDRYSVLIIFQALDAAGKDGTIKHVMSGVNPAGCQVFSFKAPSA